MFSHLGWSGVVIILVALLLIFGPSKLPEIGKAFGKGLREFKDATRGLAEDGSKNSSAEQVQTSSAKVASVEPIELKTEKTTAAE